VELAQREEKLDDKLENGRNNMHEEEGKKTKKGLNGIPVWERKGREAREDGGGRGTVSWEKGAGCPQK
jgi:hypothetical protein